MVWFLFSLTCSDLWFCSLFFVKQVLDWDRQLMTKLKQRRYFRSKERRRSWVQVIGWCRVWVLQGSVKAIVDGLRDNLLTFEYPWYHWKRYHGHGYGGQVEKEIFSFPRVLSCTQRNISFHLFMVVLGNWKIVAFSCSLQNKIMWEHVIIHIYVSISPYQSILLMDGRGNARLNDLV